MSFLPNKWSKRLWETFGEAPPKMQQDTTRKRFRLDEMPGEMYQII